MNWAHREFLPPDNAYYRHVYSASSQRPGAPISGKRRNPTGGSLANFQNPNIEFLRLRFYESGVRRQCGSEPHDVCQILAR